MDRFHNVKDVQDFVYPAPIKNHVINAFKDLEIKIKIVNSANITKF